MKSSIYMRTALGTVLLGSILFFQNCGKVENNPILNPSLLSIDQANELAPEVSARLDNIFEVITDANKDGVDDSLLFWQENFVIQHQSTLLLAQQASVAMLVELTGFNGNILSFYASAPLFEELRLEYKNGELILSKFTNDKSYTRSVIAKDLNGYNFIGLRTGQDPEDIEIVLNGETMEFLPQTIGTPKAFSYLSKTLVMNSRVVSMLLFNRALSSLDLAVLNKKQAAQMEIPLSLGANLSDQLRTPQPIDPEQPIDYFKNASVILKNKCQNCHSWAGGSEAQLLASGKVVAGSLESSSLYFRLTNSTVTSPKASEKQNMPLNTSALSSSEIKVLADWIMNIK